MEVSINKCDDDGLINAIKELLGDGDDSPNWEDMNSITIGFGKGATKYRALLWQGTRYWCLNDLLF